MTNYYTSLLKDELQSLHNIPPVFPGKCSLPYRSHQPDLCIPGLVVSHPLQPPLLPQPPHIRRLLQAFL